MTYVLILFIYAGPFAHTDAVSLTSVPGFKTADECQAAGEKSLILTAGTVKDTKYVCVEQSNH